MLTFSNLLYIPIRILAGISSIAMRRFVGSPSLDYARDKIAPVAMTRLGALGNIVETTAGKQYRGDPETISDMYADIATFDKTGSNAPVFGPRSPVVILPVTTRQVRSHTSRLAAKMGPGLALGCIPLILQINPE